MSLVRVARMGLIFLSLAGSIYAQRDLSTIVGVITDPSQAAVAGARVVVREDSTGLVYNLTTDSSGTYIRPAIKPGTYTVQVDATGFKKSTQRNGYSSRITATGVAEKPNAGFAGRRPAELLYCAFTA